VETHPPAPNVVITGTGVVAALIVMLNATGADIPPALCAKKEKLYVPAVVGVPVMTQLAPLRV